MSKLSPIWITSLTLVCLTLVSASTAQEPTVLFKQERDSANAQPLTPAELATLGDPLFFLVLKDHADITKLEDLEKKIQPDTTKRQIFVVDENIVNPARQQARRAVLTFTGINQDQNLDSNLMLSVLFNDKKFPDEPAFIEAWGFDTARGRFNYYKMDRTGNVGDRASWKLRVSSEGADLLSAAGRQGTCLACHINGAPVMKELLRPWNNWHSLDFQATYLLPTSDPTIQWPVALSSRLRGHLNQAENFEGKIIAAIRQFNSRRVEASLARGPDGSVTIDTQGFGQVLEGKRLLRPLLQTTEFNLISSTVKSGLHPIPQVSTQGPGQPVGVPNSFFLNANLIGSGGGPTGFLGLGITKAKEFEAAAQVNPAEYKRLVTETGTKLAGQPGDANFAWFVPEPSQVNNDMVDRLMRMGILSPEFVAAVLAIDLEKPVLSAERASLLRFIPDQFRFKRSNGTTSQPNAQRDELMTAVIAALEASNPLPNSTPAQFLQLLKGINLQNPQDPQNPRKVLEAMVNDYHARIKNHLDNTQTRDAELRRLYQQAINMRRTILTDNVLRNLDETLDASGNGRLLPVP